MQHSAAAPRRVLRRNRIVLDPISVHVLEKVVARLACLVHVRHVESQAVRIPLGGSRTQIPAAAHNQSCRQNCDRAPRNPCRSPYFHSPPRKYFSKFPKFVEENIVGASPELQSRKIITRRKTLSNWTMVTVKSERGAVPGCRNSCGFQGCGFRCSLARLNGPPSRCLFFRLLSSHQI